MDAARAYKFRLYPDSKRQFGTGLQLTLSKKFYNMLLEKSIKSYKGGNKGLLMAALNGFAKARGPVAAFAEAAASPDVFCGLWRPAC